jgi:DNA-binding response OmpR family regulator
LKIIYTQREVFDMNERIYIAEDEAGIRETVKTFLESEGYQVEDFMNGDLLYDRFLEEPCDLCILDVLMPGSTGFQITKKIRDISSVPIIILTARDSDIDYATGINLGSDDYFTKPFSAISLVMRVKAMLRRVQLDRNDKGGDKEEKVNYGDVSINRKTMKVTAGGSEVDLTPSEYNLLLYLAENRDRAVSRDELLDKIWGYGKDIETRACDDTVRRLRKKLQGSNVRVETVWGFGFTLKEE